jgi:HMG (high mobility group) box
LRADTHKARARIEKNHHQNTQTQQMSSTHQFSSRTDSSSSDEWTKDLDTLPWGDAFSGAESPTNEDSNTARDLNLTQCPFVSTTKTQPLSSVPSGTCAPLAPETKSGMMEKPTADQKDEIEQHNCPDAGQNNNKKKPSKRNKRAREGTPKRPLNAYNLFFRDRRESLMADHRRSFQELGKIIGREWREIDKATRSSYDKMAKIETDRYHQEMDRYHEAQRRRRDEEFASCTAEDHLHVSQAKNDHHQTRQQSIPSAPSTSLSADPTILCLLPPGGTIMMPGADGIIRSYRVEYKTFQIKKRDIDSGKLATLLHDSAAQEDRKRPPTGG